MYEITKEFECGTYTIRTKSKRKWYELQAKAILGKIKRLGKVLNVNNDKE